MNRMFSHHLVWFVGLMGAAMTGRATPLRAAGPPACPIDQRMVARLVEQLGAEKFSERQAAGKALLACGRPALSALPKVTSHEDLEVRQRARKLILIIDADVIALRARGVRVKVDEGRPDHAIVSVDFSDAQATDQDMRWLAQQPRLQNSSVSQGQAITNAGLAHFRDHPALAGMVLRRAKITDKGLHVLGMVKNLQGLDIGFTGITGVGLRHLTRLKRFAHLTLISTKLNDEGMKQVGKLSYLKSMFISQAEFTDEGMKHLGRIGSLQHLIIDLVPAVTDAGLLRLRTLKKLKSLSFCFTKVTENGKASLEQAMPWGQIF